MCYNVYVDTNFNLTKMVNMMKISTEIDIKVRNSTEAKFIADVTKLTTDTIEKYNLNINHLRFARKAGYGGRGAKLAHTYSYTGGPKVNTIEFWVNVRNTKLNNDFKNYLIAAMISGANQHAKKVSAFQESDITLYETKTGKSVDRLYRSEKMPMKIKRFLASERQTYNLCNIYKSQAVKKVA